MSENAAPPSTDATVEKVTKRTGKGSKQKCQDNYRRKKNEETDRQIMEGIFQRLKVTDPTAVPAVPLTRESYPLILPVGFSKLPLYCDKVWDTMQAIGIRTFQQLDQLPNKAIFKK